MTLVNQGAGFRGRDLPAKGPRVLVVDDDPDIAGLLASWLAALGDVYTATTSAQALALAAVVPFHLAVIDIILPRMDGFRLAAALRQQFGLADLPVVFITGSDRVDILVRADEFGGATVMYKPIRQEALEQAVAGLLGPPPAASV